MISQPTEAVTLSNVTHFPRRKNSGLGARKSTDNSRKGKRNVHTKQSLYQERVSRALKRASKTRTKQLQRPLSPDEWKRLKLAVKKQCRAIQTDNTSVQLRALFRRVVQLENCTPQGAQALSDSIGMFSLQVSALREQALRHVLEHDELRPSCGHFRQKKVVSVQSAAGARFFRKLPNIGYVSYSPNDRLETMACKSCVQSREDSVFLWTGEEFNSFESFTDSSPISLAVIKASGLSGVHPLSIQEVWSSILTQKYGGMD